MTLNQTMTLPFSVENDELNSDHRLIFGLIDKAEAAMSGDIHESEVVSALLMELRDYASYHFGAEEALFEIHAYPDAKEHTDHHLEFRAHLSELMALTKEGDKTVRLKMIHFLRMWFRDHIKVRDKAYIPYLRDVTPGKVG